MKKLMIASPCYQGKVDTRFTLSLIQSLYLLDHSGIQSQVLLPESGSILSKERNDIIEAFWQSDCTHLLCVDSDIGWAPAAPLHFLNYDLEFISGVYPARRNTDRIPKFFFIPESEESGRLIQSKDGKLIKMKGVPAGFMMLSRDCISKMRDFYPEKKYVGSNNFDSAYALFNTEIQDGMMLGEDYVFCRNAINAGIEIWCDPSIVFDHAGEIGSLSEILTTSRPVIKDTFVYETK